MDSKDLIILVFLILNSCGYSSTSIPGGSASSPNGLAANPGAGGLSFAAVKTQVFQAHCLRCHSQASGNRGGVNLESYRSVQPLIGTIRNVVNRGSMPPSGGMPGASIDLLNQWIQAGAPEAGQNADSGTNPPSDVTNPNPQPTPPPGSPCDDDDKFVQFRRGGRC
jgi:hypothetical protein